MLGKLYILYFIVKFNNVYFLFLLNYIFFFFSDPYVRIELSTIVGNVAIDSVLTKTKKKVNNLVIYVIIYLLIIENIRIN